MLFHWKNGSVPIGNDDMDYVRFGNGKQTLIFLPGLGDGLRTVKGTALPMSLMYRRFGKNYTVYMFSRRNTLPAGYTTRDMARDLKEAMNKLGIRTAAVIGVSMGGMIAQHLAVDYPEVMEGLVLTVTAARPNPILKDAVSEWVELAQKGDHTAFMDSNVRRIYSDAYYRKNKWMVPIVGKLTKPKSYERFFIQADACLTHDAFDRLTEIRCPALVIGGAQDRALGGDASRELAAKIPDARLHMYAEWGHGLYEEAKDFNQIVLDFLEQ